jgi:hypothetical protein
MLEGRGGDVTEQDHDEQVLAISRIVDQVAEEFLGGEPDWEPLHVVLPLEWCDGFMWMFRVEEGDAVVEMYKHGITRNYLMLDQHNRAYRYTGDGHVRIPVALAIDHVFAGIEEMGWSRETAYDEEFVAEKHRQLREAGWTVITTAAPGSGELMRELDALQEDDVSDEI